MATKGKYYIGRVLKLGKLNQKSLIHALKNPSSIHHGKHAWTFLDVHEYRTKNRHYIFGRMSKYEPSGEVSVVDVPTHSEKKQIEPNLVIASSPFIYIPEHSGIAFLYVSSHIKENQFTKHFCEIIKKTHDNFFVDCDIEFISDLKTFAAKLSSLNSISKIKASVSPPNPLFSPLWGSLKDYLKSRDIDRMTISEDAPENKALRTKLPEIVELTANQDENTFYEPTEALPIGDAAILMAADGYGNGTIIGNKDDKQIVINTSDTRLSFSFEKIPEADLLYDMAEEILVNIQKKRHMEHD